MKCRSCQFDMEIDLHCLVGKPSEDMGTEKNRHFQGYRTELWKCPKCGVHSVFVIKNAWILFEQPRIARAR